MVGLTGTPSPKLGGSTFLWGLTRVQQDLQLYCPFVDVPELDPLHEDIDAAKDDLNLAKSSDRSMRTGRGVATSTFVTFSFDEKISSAAGRLTE